MLSLNTRLLLPRIWRTVVVTALPLLWVPSSVIFTGCDVRPPALHTQLEELRIALNDALAEKLMLEKEVAGLREQLNSLQQAIGQTEQDNKVLQKRIAALAEQTKHLTAARLAALTST